MPEPRPSSADSDQCSNRSSSTLFQHLQTVRVQINQSIVNNLFSVSLALLSSFSPPSLLFSASSRWPSRCAPAGAACVWSRAGNRWLFCRAQSRESLPALLPHHSDQWDKASRVGSCCRENSSGLQWPGAHGLLHTYIHTTHLWNFHCLPFAGAPGCPCLGLTTFRVWVSKQQPQPPP